MTPRPDLHAAFLARAVATLALLTALTLALSVLLLSPSSGDLVRLAIFLPLSGGISLAGALGFVGLYRGGLFRGIGGKLLLAVVLSAGLVMINVGFTAYIMFLSSHDLTLMALLLVFSFGIAAFFALVTARLFHSQLAVLLDGVRRLGSGDLESVIELRSGDELEDIARAFNAMAGQLAEAAETRRDGEEARRQLIAAVSHDLRTPLATMRAMVESINDGVVSDAATIARYHRTMQGEIAYLSRLIDDLFELSQLDSGLLELRREASSISDLISDTVEALRPQAEQRKLMLLGEVPSSLPEVLIDVPRIQRVLYNLVQNALRHTPADGSVLIRAVDSDEEVRISVEDTGEGLGADELPRVFDRFYRGDRARSREEAGSGIGLTIAKGIIELHGGTIWALSDKGAGAVFTFALPKARSLSNASRPLA